MNLKFPSALTLYFLNECILDWFLQGYASVDKSVLHCKIGVLQLLTFALPTITCQFPLLHQSMGMLFCVCGHKRVTSNFLLVLIFIQQSVSFDFNSLDDVILFSVIHLIH
jgi:hypothetical protein